MIEYFNLIFWLSVALGVPLYLGGIALRRYGDPDVAGVMMWIGGICAAGGFVCVISLQQGEINYLALLAVVFAFFGEVARPDQRVGVRLLALGLALAAVNQLPGLRFGGMWLTTVAILAALLGLISVANSLLRRQAKDQST